MSHELIPEARISLAVSYRVASGMTAIPVLPSAGTLASCVRAGLLVLVSLILCIPASGQIGDAIRFRFGEASITVERRVVLSQPSPYEYSADAWGRAMQFDMRQDQSLYLELP